MKIWTRPLMGVRPGESEPVDTGQDEVMVDECLRVGYCGREPDSSVCLIGHPSDELICDLREHFGSDRHVTFPSVILDKHRNPILYGEGEEDE